MARERKMFRNCLVSPYHKNFVKLPYLLKQYLNINLIFRNSGLIKQKLINNKPINLDGCVYKIPCGICNKYYIGQTGKSLEKRISQHKYCIRSADGNNALFNHVDQCNHAIDFDNSTIYKYVSNIAERNIF